MDGRRFDDLLRAVTDSRRSLLGVAFAGIAGLFGLSDIEAKKKHKKKKPCKKKCKDGCCTNKNGKCIKPARQSSTQCGTGGEICRSDCGGGACGAGCETCCANGECLDAGQIGNEQCGINGEACFACPAGQACNAPGPGCCATRGAECGSNDVECCPSAGTCGQDNVCCKPNHESCAQTDECCDDDDICDGGFCGRPEGAACEPGSIWCTPNLSCNPETLTCGPQDCTVPCAELGRCSEQFCPGVLNCCTQACVDGCSGSEDFCGCITEGCDCTRIML